MSLTGEIGGTNEQEAAEFIQKPMTRPVIAYVARSSASPGRRMGHAGAIISGSASKASKKMESLAAAGATVVQNFGQIGLVCKDVLKS